MSLFETEKRDEVVVREEKRELEVLLMYEDFGTGLRARRLLDGVVNSLDLEVDFRVNLWRLDLLREPALLQRATVEAAHADMVFLAVHGENELPAAVHLWLNRWLEHKGSEPCALAVVLDPASEEAPARSRAMEALNTVARLTGVDLFVQAAQPPPTEWESAVQDIQRRAVTRTGLLDEMLHRQELSSHRDWGINE
jgi:hypothetical protein